MTGFRLAGNTSGNVAEVSASGELLTSGGSAVKEDAGFAVMTCENSDGTYIGGIPYRESPLVTGDKRLAVGLDTPSFDYDFNSTISNSNIWKTSFTTQTITASSGFLNLNANSTVGTTTYCYYQTWKHFIVRGNAGLHVSFGVQNSLAIPTNQIFEGGLFLGVVNTLPLDGVFFRWTSAGLTGVVSYSATETTQLFTYTPTTGVSFGLSMVIYDNEVEFWVQPQGSDPKLLGEIAVPSANGSPFLTQSLPLCFSNRNSGAVTSPAIIKVATCHVDIRDINLQKSYNHQQAAMGMHCSVLPDGSTIPTTGAKSSLWANNTAPTAAAITNTSAAFTGLGGIVAVLPTLAAATDGVLISYQNPVGGVAQTPRTLYITGVSLQGAVSVILAGGPVIYTYALAYGHTAVSLAAAQTASFATATSKAPVIVPLGAIDSFAVTAAVGVIGQRLVSTFDSPIVVNPGEFIQVVARNIGTVTTTGAITFDIGFTGYWE